MHHQLLHDGVVEHAAHDADAEDGDRGSDWGDEAAALADADSLSEWGATDDGNGSRHGSAAPSPDRRPSASPPLSKRAYCSIQSRLVPHCSPYFSCAP